MSPGSTVVSTLELEQLAKVEVTSEDPNFPIESALVSGTGPGWRAAEKGKQIVRSSWIGRDVATLYELERLDDGARVSPVALPDLLMHFLLNRRARR
jgi:hypothetical protein